MHDRLRRRVAGRHDAAKVVEHDEDPVGAAVPRAVAGLVHPTPPAPSLEVGPADHPAERRADAVADRAVHALAHLRAAPGRPEAVRRRVGASTTSVVGREGGSLDGDAADAIDRARHGGTALPPAVQGVMQGLLGRNLDGVRMHTGPVARRLAESVQAEAFTIGHDVFFRDGAPDVGSARGQHLLAHEVAHTAHEPADASVARRAVLYEEGNAGRKSHDDYAVMKQIGEVMRHPHAGGLFDFNAVKGTGMTAETTEEPLWIVGHGDRTTGELKNMAFADLVKLVGMSHVRGQPKTKSSWPPDITVLSCYSGDGDGVGADGTTRTAPFPDGPYAARLKNALKQRDTTVRGARGFSFGSPTLADSGASSVMPSDQRALFELKDTDKMVAEWGKIPITRSDLGVVGEYKGKVAAKKVKAGTTIAVAFAQDPGWIRSTVQAFAAAARTLQDRMEHVVRGADGATVPEKQASLARTPEFEDLVREQHALYEAHYLFRPAEDAFAAF